MEQWDISHLFGLIRTSSKLILLNLIKLSISKKEHKFNYRNF